MQVRVIVNTCDALLAGGKKALFGGQAYDLPPGEARRLIDEGMVEPVEAKMVERPAHNKARRPRRNK